MMGDPGEGREASLPRFTKNNIAFVVVVVVVIVIVIVVVVVVIVVFIVAQVYKLRLKLLPSLLLFAVSASL